MNVKNEEVAFTTLIRRLMDSFHFLARNMLREEDLSLAQYYTLHSIKANTCIRMRDIKDNLRVSAPYATSIIDKLVKKGVIERYRSKDDRRVVTIRLTVKGEILIRDLNKKKAQFYAKLLKDMNGNDKKVMSEGLSLLVSSLNRVLGK